MANNIYIGNRYVPVFADPVEWNNLREYEPLTIVTYQGTAYTSRKTVPVGTALDNTEYWVVTGNYNAQVEAYRQEVSALSGEVDTLQADIIPLKERKILFIGDSYDTLYTPRIASRVAGYMKLDANHYRNISTSGYGFVSNGRTWLAKLEEQLPTITDPETFTDVLIYGGANDTISTIAESAIISAITAIDGVIRTNFPNANIHLAFMGWTRVINNRKYYRSARIAYQKGAAINGWDMLIGPEYVLHNYSLLMDTSGNEFHPTATGAEELAKILCAALNGTAEVRYSESVTFTNTLEDGTFTGTCNVSLINDKIRLTFGNVSVDTRNSANPPSRGTWNAVAMWNSNLIGSPWVIKLLGDGASPSPVTRTSGYAMFRFSENGNFSYSPFFDVATQNINAYFNGSDDTFLMDTMNN